MNVIYFGSLFPDHSQVKIGISSVAIQVCFPHIFSKFYSFTRPHNPAITPLKVRSVDTVKKNSHGTLTTCLAWELFINNDITNGIAVFILSVCTDTDESPYDLYKLL